LYGYKFVVAPADKFDDVIVEQTRASQAGVTCQLSRKPSHPRAFIINSSKIFDVAATWTFEKKNMYAYIHTHIYIHIYIYIHTHVRAYARVYTYENAKLVGSGKEKAPCERARTRKEGGKKISVVHALPKPKFNL